jgi:hypothetical protein
MLSWPGQPEKVQNVTFDGLISWTYCYGFKVGQGIGVRAKPAEIVAE